MWNESSKVENEFIDFVHLSSVREKKKKHDPSM